MSRVVTQAVVQQVEEYIYSELSDENRTPLDESVIWSLHALAAGIYQLGFDDGERVESARARAQRLRERDRAKS